MIAMENKSVVLRVKAGEVGGGREAGVATERQREVLHFECLCPLQKSC